MANNGYKGFSTLEKYYTDNGTSTGTTKANTVGDADYVAPVQDLSTCPLDTVPPSTPTALSLESSPAAYSLSITWIASTDNNGMDHYEVYVNSVLYATTIQTSLTITELTPSTTYAIKIRGVDIDGNVSAFATANFSTASQYNISLDTYGATIDFLSQNTVFNITSNYPAYTYASSDSSWLTASGGNGGNQTVTVHATKNIGVDRYAGITVIYNGVVIAGFSVTQTA